MPTSDRSPVRRRARRVLTLFARHAERTTSALTQVITGGTNGALLALLDRRQIEQIDRQKYELDGIYSDVDYISGGLFWWEQAIVRRHFPIDGSVFVWGAGAGREVMALSKLGYRVSGEEYNQALVNRANELLAGNGFSERITIGRRDTWPPSVRDCDVVVFGWSSFTLVRGREQRVELLRAAARSLSADGLIVMSFFVGDPQSRSLRWAHRGGRLTAAVFGGTAPEPGDILTPNFAHLFSMPALIDELHDAGLELVGSSTLLEAWAVARRMS